METILLLPFLSFLTESLTENHTTVSNSIETTKHETLTQISSTIESEIATIKSMTASSEYENFATTSSTSAMTTTEEVFIRKITMSEIQIVFLTKLTCRWKLFFFERIWDWKV